MESQQILREFKTLETGSAFLSNKFLDLQNRYGDQFIAIKESKVVAHAPSFDQVKDKIQEQKLGIKELIIEFIPAKGKIILY